MLVKKKSACDETKSSVVFPRSDEIMQQVPFIMTDIWKRSKKIYYVSDKSAGFSAKSAEF